MVKTDRALNHEDREETSSLGRNHGNQTKTKPKTVVLLWSRVRGSKESSGLKQCFLVGWQRLQYQVDYISAP